MSERNAPDDISLGKLAETSPSAITKVDKHGNIVYANSRAEEVLGLEKSEITDRTYDNPDWKITDFEGNDCPQEKLPFQIVKNTEKPVCNLKHAIEWPDGDRKFLSINTSPLFDEDGNFDGMVSVIEDITDQVKTREELEKSKERYRKYFEKSGEAIYVLKMGGGDHGKILDVNPQAEVQSGYSRRELIGMNMVDDLSIEIVDMDSEEANKKLTSGETVTFTDRKERKDGSEYWSEVVVTPLQYEGKQANLSINRDITDRKEVRKELEKSEAKFRAMAEQAHDGLFIHSYDKILWANDRVSEIIGYSNEEIYQENPMDFLHPEDRDRVKGIAKRRVAGKDVPSTYEARLVRKDGRVRNCEFAVTRIEYNEKQAFLGAVRDITERKKAEEKLRESEKKYRSLFNSIRDAILVADTERNITNCNPACTELFGYDLEEIEGKKTKYLYHDEEEYEEMGDEIRESMDDPSFFYTIHYERKSGEVFPGETNVFYLRGDEGEVVGFIGLIRDISERIARKEALERSQKRYQTIFGNTGTAMIIIEEDTKISLANEEAEKMTGYSKEEIEGKISWTELVADDKKLEKMKEYHKLRRQNPSAAPNQYEFKLVDKKGHEKDVLISIDVIPGTEKSVASLMDITERKKSRKQLQQSEDKLRESFIELAETTSRVLGVRDPYTQKHELKVGELAKEVGQRMGLEEEKQLGLYLGGVLHDIGKIAVPETILTKPGDLKDVEWRMIKSHPRVGYNQILEDTDFPWPVAEMTLHHHERLDGSGYPDGLEGDELTTEVRILGAVDVVEAMSTRRPYRAARSKERTLKVMKEGKGNKFDPEVVEILVAMIEEGEIDFGEGDRRNG